VIDRPKTGERAILVQLALPELDADVALAEFKELALSADAEILTSITGSRKFPEPKYFIGLGKAQELQASVCDLAADLVLVNHELTPSQERNLERLLQCRVVDRRGLILDIFAQRARTHEGKLQVELAQLQHLSTRLVRGWTHLERQKGGIGLRGPGETQLETDRRLLRERIKSIHKRLEKVRQSRAQNRQARQKAALPSVSLVGYTNAGKSSLFNVLTNEHIYAANQLFATLDPTMRKWSLNGHYDVLLIDTVGFIRDLPHHLVAAFKATLEETIEADLLLHVIDIADNNWRAQVQAVEQVLQELKVKGLVMHVFNKIDLKDNLTAKFDDTSTPPKVWLSAQTHAGLTHLQEAVIRQLFGKAYEEELFLTPDQAALRAKLYGMRAVMAESLQPNGNWRLIVQLTRQERQKLAAIFHI
tara:strand:- start:135 stop:1388 length:1254 start_codon:yes stop_codon:yes gene_type:complete